MSTVQESQSDANLSIGGYASDSDGEMLVDETINSSMNVDQTNVQQKGLVDISLIEAPEDSVKSYSSRQPDFVTGFDPTSTESRERREARLKRFGDNLDEPNVFSDEAIDLLYASLGVSRIMEENIAQGVRMDAVHVRGVDHLTSADIFRYFSEFAPSGIEWVDDSTCNVVWMDSVTTIRALLKLSRECGSGGVAGETERVEGREDVGRVEEEMDETLDLLDDEDHEKLSTEKNNKTAANETKNGDKTNEDADRKKKITPITFDGGMDDKEGKEGPPPGKWRLGVSPEGILPPARTVEWKKSGQTIYMRFAVKGDRYIPGTRTRRGELNSDRYLHRDRGSDAGYRGDVMQRIRKRGLRSDELAEENEFWSERQKEEEEKRRRENMDETPFEEHLRQALKRVGGGRAPVNYDDLSDSAAEFPDEQHAGREKYDKKPRFRSDSASSSSEYSEGGGASEGEGGGVRDEELERLLALPESKHKMSMHADFEDQRPLKHRLGLSTKHRHKHESSSRRHGDNHKHKKHSHRHGDRRHGDKPHKSRRHDDTSLRPDDVRHRLGNQSAFRFDDQRNLDDPRYLDDQRYHDDQRYYDDQPRIRADLRDRLHHGSRGHEDGFRSDRAERSRQDGLRSDRTGRIREERLRMSSPELHKAARKLRVQVVPD